MKTRFQQTGNRRETCGVSRKRTVRPACRQPGVSWKPCRTCWSNCVPPLTLKHGNGQTSRQLPFLFSSINTNDDRAGSSLCCPACETPILVPGQRSPLPSSRPGPNLMPSRARPRPSSGLPRMGHWHGVGFVFCRSGTSSLPIYPGRQNAHRRLKQWTRARTETIRPRLQFSLLLQPERLPCAQGVSTTQDNTF